MDVIAVHNFLWTRMKQSYEEILILFKAWIWAIIIIELLLLVVGFAVCFCAKALNISDARGGAEECLLSSTSPMK